MGIKDLLRHVEHASRPAHLSEWRGQTVAVDVSCWLHRGAFGCARDVVENRAAPKLTAFVLHRCGLLRHNGIEPLLVFDGANLQLKAPTDSSRTVKRRASLREAQRLWKARRWEAATAHYQKAIRIRRHHVVDVIAALRGAKGGPIQFVVAPNEADAQLVQVRHSTPCVLFLCAFTPFAHSSPSPPCALALVLR
jgi:exonuclease-1